MDSRTADLVRTSLASVFGAEWAQLSPADQALILQDVTEPPPVDNLQAYRRSIGAGNLFAYVKTQRARFGRRS